MSLLGSGSPVRYFLPGVPVVIGATLSAMLPGWKWRSEPPWFVSLALSTLLGFAVTAYLVRTVNFKLFFAGQRVTRADRARLLDIWYRANILRLLTTGGAWFVAARLASRLQGRPGLKRGALPRLRGRPGRGPESAASLARRLKTNPPD